MNSSSVDRDVSPRNLADADDPAVAIEQLRHELRIAESADTPLLRAALWLELGMALQAMSAGGRPQLLEAIHAYQQALQEGITAESHPDSFGLIQNNLGLAYLAMPTREAGDQLRTAIAVQSFRHALQVYGRESHPGMWATVTMNLANAIQYMPSSHPEENLVQAVEAYEQVLQVRTEASDPVAHAIALVNQANALAHLGMFEPAQEKAARAHAIFTRHGRDEQAAAARGLRNAARRGIRARGAVSDPPAASKGVAPR